VTEKKRPRRCRRAPGPPARWLVFLPVVLWFSGRKPGVDASQAPLFPTRKISPPAGLTNRQRSRGAGQLFVVDCDSAPAALKWPAMSTKSREVVWGGQILGADIRPLREADRAEAHAWSVRIGGYGGPAQPSPTIAQCLNGGLGWLEVECNRCKTHASLPLDAIRQPRDTPIWKLEASLKCRSCRKGRWAPPVRMLKLTEARSITPYKWCIRTRSG
jgi:hypothetical protein